MNVVHIPRPKDEETHIEQREGEIFLGYYNRDTFNAICLETKREGQLYLNKKGEIIGQGGYPAASRLFPVFVQRPKSP